MGIRARAWERRYGRKLLATDTIIVLASVFGAQHLRFALFPEHTAASGSPQSDINHSLLSLCLSGGWLLVLAIGDSRDPKVFGVGPEEYKRVINLTLFTFGMYAITAFAIHAAIGRGYLLIALPSGLALLLLSRWGWRKRLHSQRKKRRNTYHTLIVGERKKSAHVAQSIAANGYAGIEVVGAVTEHGDSSQLVSGLPVVASYDGLIDAVDELGIDMLVMTSSDAIDPQRMREIGWNLEARKVDLVLTPSLTDIAGPRIHLRPVSGLPFIHVDLPEFSGRKQFAKRVFDIVCSAALIVLSAPVMLAVAIAVKTTSKGPVFYKQDRVGFNGKPFPMLKFRSMVVNADDQLASLLSSQGTSDKPLHKVTNDPRITPVGHFIRKYSLDELPQFFNVFLGSMSMVGPRPQRAAEVALYKEHDHRRLLVKPGITGIWQVSGRSNTDWEDAIRLDLYYVENWSITGDLLIVFKTVRAVVRATGAT